MVSDPDVGFVPLQLPDAVHEVALVLVQLSNEVAPLAMLAGDAERVTVGAGLEPGLVGGGSGS